MAPKKKASKGGDKSTATAAAPATEPVAAASAGQSSPAPTATPAAAAADAAAAPTKKDKKQKPAAAADSKDTKSADNKSHAPAAASGGATASTSADAKHAAAAVLMYDLQSPPLAVLGLLELSPTVKQTTKNIGKAHHPATSLNIPATRDQLTGLAVIRYLARVSDATAHTKFYGSDALTATHVDSFLELSLSAANADLLPKIAQSVNAHLAMRMFLVSHQLTIADLALWEALRKNRAWAGLDKNDLPHLQRWFAFVDDLPALKTASSTVSKTAEKLADAKAAGASGGSFNIPLPGAEMGKMVTRFPPEPSGYLHIGHAKAALLNNYFAREWKGQLILRFDDTNPGKEKQEYVDNIMSDLATLEIKHDRLTHTSDYFQQCEDYAKQLLRDGLAYCDNTPVLQIRKERMDGIDSKCRNQSVEENLRIFDEMLAGSEEGLKYVMRAKIDMKLNNKCLRDPNLYRCNVAIPHHRTGTRFKAYPMYDFACPIVDSLEGVTHCLRTSEYHDRNEQYNWVLKALRLKHHPHIWDYSRLSFVYTLLSKRKLQWFVDEKIVEGWNDPRFPTVQGMIRRGLTVPALREFILLQGASKAITTQEWDKLWTINKYHLDPVVPRYTAVDRDNKIEFRFTNVGSKLVGVSVPLVPKDKSKGNKVVMQGPVIYIDHEDATLIADGEEITLMSWGNAIAKKVVREKTSAAAAGSGGGRVLYIEGELHLAGNVKSTSKKLTWIAATNDDLVPCVLTEFDHLITERSLMKGQDHKQFLTKQTKYETPALGEPSMRLLQKGDTIQLQRRGFYKVDTPYQSPQKPMILFFVPDGKTKAMSLLGNKTQSKK